MDYGPKTLKIIENSVTVLGKIFEHILCQRRYVGHKYQCEKMLNILVIRKMQIKTRGASSYIQAISKCCRM